jgi:hypothetical protein
MPDDKTFLSEHIFLVDGLPNKFSSLQQPAVIEARSNILNVINGYIEYRDELIKRVVAENSALIERFQQLSKDACERNRLNSDELNYFRLFPLGETGHSYQLATLLNPYAEHGQGRLFLAEFLKMLNFEKPEEGYWTVTAEEGRIDVLLRRRNPLSVIIIENKSNDAIDQPNQLYRYWYQEIYRDQPTHLKSDQSGHYRIVYLSSGDCKKPGNNSLQRPADWDKNLPQKLPIEPDLWSFDKHIIQWLGQCRDLLPRGNFRMRDYLNQYIELWSKQCREN